MERPSPELRCACCRTEATELFRAVCDNKMVVHLCAYCYGSDAGMWKEYERNHRDELPMAVVIASCFNILERRLEKLVWLRCLYVMHYQIVGEPEDEPKFIALNERIPFIPPVGADCLLPGRMLPPSIVKRIEWDQVDRALMIYLEDASITKEVLKSMLKAGWMED